MRMPSPMHPAHRLPHHSGIRPGKAENGNHLGLPTMSTGFENGLTDSGNSTEEHRITASQAFISLLNMVRCVRGNHGYLERERRSVAFLNPGPYLVLAVHDNRFTDPGQSGQSGGRVETFLKSQAHRFGPVRKRSSSLPARRQGKRFSPAASFIRCPRTGSCNILWQDCRTGCRTRPRTAFATFECAAGGDPGGPLPFPARANRFSNDSPRSTILSNQEAHGT